MSGITKRIVIAVLGVLVVLYLKLTTFGENIVTFRLAENTSVKVQDNFTGPVNFFNKTVNGPGVIVTVSGGIGNQLFEYACSYALARRRNCSLYNFIHRNDNTTVLPSSRKFSPWGREYAMDKFEIPIENFIDKTTVIKPEPIGHLNDSELLYGKYKERSFLRLSYGSYCQSEAYWKEYKSEILSMFHLRQEIIREFPQYVIQIEEMIKNSEESVALHVRRGDFQKYPGVTMPILYQRTAIQTLLEIFDERKKNGSMDGERVPKFFVFSDDIDYAQKEFKDLASTNEFVFVAKPDKKGTRTTSIQDFYLMTRCKHFIIPNSTFAWWAAYLSMNWHEEKSRSGRIFIAAKFNPKYYDHRKDKHFHRMLYEQMYYPKNWIIIDVFNGSQTGNHSVVMA